MLTEDQKKEIVSLLQARLVKNGRELTCPMCGNNHFTVADAYFLNMLVTDLKAVPLGGPAVPAMSLICLNCGCISQHALGILGLLPESEVQNDKK